MAFRLIVLLVATATYYAGASSVAAATYYVSNSGNDSRVGTSPETAWATLARAAIAAGEAKGTTLLLERNSTWLNDPLVLSSWMGGALVIGAYGDKTLPRPLLQHARGLSDSSTACLEIATSFAATTVSGLHFSGCEGGLVLVGNASAATPTSNVLIADNIFQDVRTPFLRYTPPNPDWANAIALRGGHLRNVTIRNNVGARIDAFFSSTARVDTLTLDANTVQQCSGNCYGLGQGTNLTMSNSVLLRDTSTRLFLYGTTDVIIGSVCTLHHSPRPQKPEQ